MIRVLHLTTHLNTGGITTYIYRLIKPLKEIGVETHVLSGGGEMVRAFQERGALTYELPIQTKSELHPKLYFAIPKIIEIIRKNNLQIIHAHTRISQVMAYWIQWLIGIPVITTCHGFYKPRLGRKLLPCWGNTAIAISEGVALSLEKDFGLKKEKIQMIHNAVNIQEFESAYLQKDPALVRKHYGFGPKDPVLGVVARLVKDKGHEYLVRAMSELKQTYPSIRLLIVGDGREKSNLANLTNQLGLSENIVMTGTIQDITFPLAAMDIFILPATWREGFGLSIIEAMICKKPVIVTNIWSLNTLIQDQVTGLMIEPKSTQSIEQAVRKLLENPSLKSKIAEQGRQMSEKLFGIHRMAGSIKTVYESILRQSPQTSAKLF